MLGIIMYSFPMFDTQLYIFYVLTFYFIYCSYEERYITFII